MTDHNSLKMYHEDRRVMDKAILERFLSVGSVANVALHDEPYPYIVPMNYGYIWDDKLKLYMHMARQGHRIDLLRENNNVAVNINMFLDRVGFAEYRNEGHDYRSITVFGKADILTAQEDPEEFLRGFNALNINNGRPAMTVITSHMEEAYLLRVTAEEITAKAQYPLMGMEEADMPENHR